MFPDTKSDLIQNFKKFSENTILNYSSDRNFDYGPPHHNVSKLSPFLKRRFISEEEILEIILEKHEYKKIEKFIEEIFWKTYWRGWLHLHPWVYNQYEKYPDDEFIPPQTGIKCFDYWKDELIETGYLHNHSRMWFASIWIFTLRYSWEAGANFFKNHLIDWCPASNTLGWKWVAGLQTIGKPYIAKADNIKLFTNNRFYPNQQLIEKVDLPEQSSSNTQALKFDVKQVLPLKYKENIGIILNNNDLNLDQIFDELKLEYHCCLFITKSKNFIINDFETKIYNDVIQTKKHIEIAQDFKKVLNWIELHKIKNLIIPYETLGTQIFNNQMFLNKLNEKSINYLFYLRDWDRFSFPYANKGFFNFKKNIPFLLKLNGFL
jgi:deoxyribodipyrimidine photo-lyase